MSRNRAPRFPGARVNKTVSEYEDFDRHTFGLSAVLRGEGSPDRAERARRAAGRCHPAVYQCGDESVQGCVSGHRPPGLPAGGGYAEMHSGLGASQRPGGGGLQCSASYVFRNAGQLVVRRLFQAGGHRVGVGIADRGLGAAQRPTLRHRIRRRRRRRTGAGRGGGSAVDGGNGPPGGPGVSAGQDR